MQVTITLNNNSTLAVINTAAITIAGTILENGGSASNTSITVKFNTANTVSEKVTFSGAVTADAIYVGDTAAATYAGYAHFTGSGGVTVTDATVTSGNHANEYSIMKFDYAVTASNEITINDKNETAYQAYLIFSGDNTVTIAGNIVTADDEGTLQVTGTGKTFTGSIGSSTYQLELINIDVATTFNGAVYTTDLEVDGAITSTNSLFVSEISTINADVTTTGTQTYTGAVTLNADVILTTTDNNISFGSTINSFDTTYRDLSLVTGSGNVSVTGIIGADDKLDVLTVNNTGTLTLSAATTVNTLTLTHTGGTTIGGTLTATTINLTDTTDAADITFNGNVSATTLNTAAEGYNVIFNGTTSTITNLVTFSNSGSVTFGNGTGDTTTFTGGVTATAPSQVNLAGTIQTTNNTMSLGDAGTPIVLTANTILSGNTAGAITLGGTVNGAYSLTVNTTGDTTFTLAVGNTTALTTLTTNASGTTYINGGAITTSSTQTYNDAVVLGADTTLTTTDSNITFSSTVDGDGTARDLTIDMDNGVGADGTVQFINTVGANDDLDVIDITGNLNLDAAITNATSLSVSSTSNLGADVTTSSTQTYTSGVTLSGADRTLTASIVNFVDTLAGGTNGLTITGNLDLDGAATGLSTLEVSGTSNLGADVTTSSTQTYSGDATISNDITLTTTNSNVLFGGTTNAGTAGDTLTIAAGSGDVTFTDAVGGSTAMGNITITTGALSAAAIKVQGTIDITNTDTSSITGIISDGASSAIVTKAGSGTLTLSGNNTYTGQTNINAGIISITDNNSLGTTAGATIVADGASLSISNDITSAENITISGTGISSNGAIRNTADDNTLTGLITLGAHSEIQIDTGSSLTLNPTSGSAITGTYNLTIHSVGTSSINDPIATLNW